MMSIDANPRLRWSVPAIPFALSLCLSLSTVGSHPYWQDSGVYLTAIKELGVLYPPGFVLYEVLSFLWTKLFFFLDFTLAVHLFSSFCAALTAGTMAVAVRDLLKSRGKIFRVLEEDPGWLAEGSGILAGVLLAGGYTFGACAIYAKGYALYYLLLALLIWRMIRADESLRPREFTIVAVLIGLAWQGHPSAALIGPAFVLFVAFHRGVVGSKGLAARTLVAAACALGPSLLLLPILGARHPWLQMGNPEGVREFLGYALGRRYLTISGVFGVDATRTLNWVRYFWEEFLGIGLALMVLGFLTLRRRNRRLLLGFLSWGGLYAAVSILFKMENQYDCWSVGAWLPLYLAVGVGTCAVGQLARDRAREVLIAAGAVATAWAIWANHADLAQRDYRLAEFYARSILDPVDDNSVLLLSGDDANGLCSYLQRVGGERSDVALVTSSFLNNQATGRSDWYDEILLQRHPFLKQPDYLGLRQRFPQAESGEVAIAAFINANADGGRPIFCVRRPAPELIRRDYQLIPAGVNWKLIPRTADALPDSRYWRFPIEPEQVRSQVRRVRCQNVQYTPQGVVVKPEGNERRLLSMLLLSRFRLALALTERGQFAQAARLCQTVVALDEEFRENPEIVHLLAISLHASGEDAKAEPALRRSVEISVRPQNRATATFYLGEIARKRGDEAGALRYFRDAVATPGLDDATRREIESRLKPK
jgi:hypothetical protein